MSPARSHALTSSMVSWMWKALLISALFAPLFTHAATLTELQAQLQTLMAQLAKLQAQQEDDKVYDLGL